MFSYAQALITQISQGVACNGAHSIQERCARWLLETHDRAGTDQFLLTQEFLSDMLGVRRPSVTVAAGPCRRPASSNTGEGGSPSPTGRAWRHPASATE